MTTYIDVWSAHIDTITLEATLTGGIWDTQDDYIAGNQPVNTFTVLSQIIIMTQDTLVDLHILFRAVNWSTAAAGDNYYMDITTGLATLYGSLSTIASWDTLSIWADGVTGATLSSLPNPTLITVTFIDNGIAPPAPITVTSGSFTLTTNVPSTYTVVASSFPYKDYSVNIVAT